MTIHLNVNKKIMIMIFYLALFLLPYDLVSGENKMQTEQKNKPAWELSNTEDVKQAGNISFKGTALLVIDFQNFNANKKGFLGHFFDDKNQVIPKTKLVIEKTRNAGIPVIYLNTILNPHLMPSTKLFTTLKKSIPWNTLTPKQLEWNFAVIEDLKPLEKDYVVEKGSWSNGFRDTDLRSIIHALNIHTIIFTGVAEPIAIYGTFLGAWDEGLESILVEDCIMASSPNPATQETIHNFSKDVFYPLMGAKVTTSDYLQFS